MTLEQLGIYCFLFGLGVIAIAIAVAILKTIFRGLVVVVFVGAMVVVGWFAINGLKSIGVLEEKSPIIIESEKLKTDIDNTLNL